MKLIDDVIQKIQDAASRYDEDYIVANLELVNKLYKICEEEGEIRYLDKIIQTFCEMLDVQQEIIIDLKAELDAPSLTVGGQDMPFGEMQSNYAQAPQMAMMVEPEEAFADLEVPPGGAFTSSSQIKNAFLNYLQGIRSTKGKRLSSTTIFDYSSRINMLWTHFEKEWRAGKLEGRLQISKESFIPNETYLNVYNHLEVFEGFIRVKEGEIAYREQEGIPFSAEELKENPLNNDKNLRNTNAALMKFKKFQKAVKESTIDLAVICADIDIRPYLGQYKLGAIANQVLRTIIKNGTADEKISKTEIEKLKTERGANATFGLPLPLLATSPKDENGIMRYYKEPIVCYGETLYLNSQWMVFQKEKLINWIADWVNIHGGI